MTTGTPARLGGGKGFLQGLFYIIGFVAHVGSVDAADRGEQFRQGNHFFPGAGLLVG
jgi:hypothetical protein